METSYIIIILLIIAIFVQFRTRSDFRKKIDSLKQSQTAKLENVDRHLHHLIEDNRKTGKKGFSILLALTGYANAYMNDEDNLVMVETFKGDKMIADMNIKPLRFVPAKEVKIKKGMNVTDYKGKTYEFAPVEKLIVTRNS